MSTHGLVQSETLSRAAQKLSAAKVYAERTRDLFPDDADALTLGEQRLTTAQAAYDAAYKVYTNPFGVSKTV